MSASLSPTWLILYKMKFTKLRERYNWSYKLLITGLKEPLISPVGESLESQNSSERFIWENPSCGQNGTPTPRMQSSGQQEPICSFLNDLNSTTLLTNHRKFISSTEQSGTWTQANHTPLSPGFNLQQSSPLTPQRTWEVSNSFPASCPALCNTYLLSSTMPLSEIDFLWIRWVDPVWEFNSNTSNYFGVLFGNKLMPHGSHE